jgi:hypothetical protein
VSDDEQSDRPGPRRPRLRRSGNRTASGGSAIGGACRVVHEATSGDERTPPDASSPATPHSTATAAA